MPSSKVMTLSTSSPFDCVFPGLSELGVLVVGEPAGHRLESEDRLEDGALRDENGTAVSRRPATLKECFLHRVRRKVKASPLRSSWAWPPGSDSKMGSGGRGAGQRLGDLETGLETWRRVRRCRRPVRRLRDRVGDLKTGDET
jgi:hypothetical protein